MLMVADGHYQYLNTLRSTWPSSSIPCSMPRMPRCGCPARWASSSWPRPDEKRERRTERAATPAGRKNAAISGLAGRKHPIAQFAEGYGALYATHHLGGNPVFGRDPFARKIIVDRGSLHGVQPGQVVADHIGVIGQVTRVSPAVSEVTLITDKDQAVPVQNVRNGLRAVVFGNGETGTLDMPFMPFSADFAARRPVGDLGHRRHLSARTAGGGSEQGRAQCRLFIRQDFLHAVRRTGSAAADLDFGHGQQRSAAAPPAPSTPAQPIQKQHGQR